MSIKFTPGPWFATEEYGTGDILVYHAIRAGRNMWDETIASTWAEPNAANAHLIAAAPDLYEALSAFVSWSDADEEGPRYSSPDRRDGPNGEAEWRQWWNGQLELAARSHLLGSAAIKKARGES